MLTKEILYQSTRPQQDIDSLVDDFFEANDSVLWEMILNFLESCGEIQNTYDLSDAEEILCNRINAKLRY